MRSGLNSAIYHPLPRYTPIHHPVQGAIKGEKQAKLDKLPPIAPPEATDSEEEEAPPQARRCCNSGESPTPSPNSLFKPQP